MSFFDGFFKDLSEKLIHILEKDLVSVCELIQTSQKKENGIYIAGNGGSAAIASHVAVDLLKNAKVKARCFNEASLITCFANDFGYDKWLSEAIDRYGEKDDLAILISSSGKSQNMVNAAISSKEKGLKVVTLTGFKMDNPLKNLGDINLFVDSQSYNIVEMVHQVWLLAIVDYVIEKQTNQKFKISYPISQEIKISYKKPLPSTP